MNREMRMPIRLLRLIFLTNRRFKKARGTLSPLTQRRSSWLDRPIPRRCARQETHRRPAKPGVNETDALGARARLAKEAASLATVAPRFTALGVAEAKKRAPEARQSGAEQRDRLRVSRPASSPSFPSRRPESFPAIRAPPASPPTTSCALASQRTQARWGRRKRVGLGPAAAAMARYWLINGRGFAKKIRYAAICADRQICELGAEARMECPNCKNYIDNSDVSVQWPGLPAGVKFDPSDLQLLEHLEKKIGLGGSEPHVFIDEFIATVENDEGICYSHPENLPGMKKDGNVVHFFHRVLKAYGCGQRKRRRVITCSDHAVSDEHVRWHKTGRSKAIYDNGVTKGWKKILVLYKTPQSGGRPERAPWVMHQYHLGEKEDEKDGEIVVSKVFYQLPTKHMENPETEIGDEELDTFVEGIGPKTPKTITPQPHRANNSPCETEQNASILLDQDEELTIPIVGPDDDARIPALCTGEPQALGKAPRAQPILDESLLCLEDPSSLNDVTLLPLDYPILSQCRNEMLDSNINAFYGLADLNNVDLGTPPDLQLSDIQFGSQESIGSWLDRI